MKVGDIRKLIEHLNDDVDVKFMARETPEYLGHPGVPLTVSDVQMATTGGGYLMVLVDVTEEPEDEDEEPELDSEPVEDDLTTNDHRKFWRYESSDRKPVVVVPEDEDWEPYVRAYMDSQHYWPNVWHISDHGNWLLLTLGEEK